MSTVLVCEIFLRRYVAEPARLDFGHDAEFHPVELTFSSALHLILLIITGAK